MIPKILEKSKRKIQSICRKHGIRELAVFGSQSTGLATETSDFDFLVEFYPDSEIGLLEFFKIRGELEKIVDKRVDLVSKSGLNASTSEKILNEKQVIYAE